MTGGISGFYPRGDGALVTAPNGSVYATTGQAIVRLSPHGMKIDYNFSAKRFDGMRLICDQGQPCEYRVHASRDCQGMQQVIVGLSPWTGRI